MSIILDIKDIKLCKKVAEMRLRECISRGADTWNDKSLKRHQTGCYGEYAAVKHYGCRWSGMYYEDELWDGREWDTEVGETRATFHPDLWGGMPLYTKDEYVDAPYIWVNLRKYGNVIKAKLVGWALLNDGRKSKWWDKEQNCFIVPPEHLLEMEHLPSF